MANMNSYKVPKMQQQKMPASRSGDPRGPDRRSPDSNMSMPAPGPQGHPKMRAAVTNDPYFQNEFSAENDLKTLIEAGRIKGDKTRLNNAMRRYNELKGSNNAGVRTRNNPNDHRTMTRSGIQGDKMDGGKGRW
jgi:hypothetical protein